MVTYVESTISLGIQIVVLGIIVAAYLLKRRSKYRQHGLLMLSAVVLHIISILTVMVPSLAAFVGVPELINFADPLIVVTFVHVAAGLLAALLGIYLVGSWHLQKSLQTCFKNKPVMDVTIALWLLAIFLGITLYLVIVGAV